MTRSDHVFSLDPSQQRGVDLVLRARFGALTGPPGSGKTTTLCAALDACDARAITYALAAPTGKAARRMTQLTNRPASTLHRLLEWRGGVFTRNEDAPLDADVVIVDEASMIDYALGMALLAGTRHSRLILVGDADQLPPIGVGRMFGDLVESDVIPTVRLTTQHRAAAESWVARNAPLINRGEWPELVECKGFRHVLVEVAADLVGAVSDVARADRDVVVLAPQYAGAAGCDALNTTLDALLNSCPRDEYVTRHGVRRGARVIQTVNNYRLEVMNGQLGTVEAIDGAGAHVVFDDDNRHVMYASADVSALRLAYALTVHKTQGSEFPHVCVVCHSTHTHMLSRSLIYTAVTRARAHVTLVGDMVGLERALRTNAARRETSLVERLTGGLPAVEVVT